MGLNIQDLAIRAREFGFGQPIPQAHANPDNVPPTLEISGVPDDAAELAVICHDPDAPLPWGFTHWVLYGLPAADVTLDPSTAEQYRTGTNGTGGTGYFGPAPPAGHGPHHYYFWVYALSQPVAGAPDRETFLSQYGPSIIEQNRTIGTYEN